MPGQRLDKWLWCARLTRTRALATRLIAVGKVRVNGERTLKASRLLKAGDVVTAAYLARLFVVRVIGASERRGPATLARGLYEDLTPPAPARAPELRKGARPTKRDRRRMELVRDEPL